jgi:hypothetical protein
MASTSSTKTSLCFEQDDYVRELQDDRKTAIWVAGLSDGSTVYADDNRPGVEPYSAWTRLKRFVETKCLAITSLELRFRSNSISIHVGEASFFCRAGLGFFNGGSQIDFFIVGWMKNGILTVQRYSVPDLILVDQEIRESASAGECLIWNHPDELDKRRVES